MKKFKILLILLSLIAFKGNVYAANIEEIIIINDKNIDLQLSKDVVLSEWIVDSEIKFFKDIEITFVSKDFNDQNKLILNLASDLQLNKTYSLLTIIWPEINLDFVTWISLEDFEISNKENTNLQTQWLNRIVIKDSKTLELYFNNVLQEEEFEFKLLNELNIQSLTSNLNNKISLVLDDNIETLSIYLIMILSVKDNIWNEVIFDEDLYELNTTQDLEIANTQEKINLEEDNVTEDTLEGVALNSAETPDTWPETTILILLTFTITSIIFIRKKLFKA